jgi:hypothetical protein
MLFQVSVEVMRSMGNELALHKINRNITNLKEYYERFVEYFFKSFLMNSSNILGDVAFKSLE